jgi:hypothetical protein
MAKQPDPMEDAYIRAISGKTTEQRNVIAYFFNKPITEGGCLKEAEYMSDDEYLQIVRSKRDSLDLRTKAINKIGLDEDELSEMPPVCFEGFTFKDAWAKKNKSGQYVSSCYQVSWLFFSSEQIYLYQYVIYLDENKKKESTEEYFYSDVTSFATRTESESAKNSFGAKVDVETNKFAMVVPGATLTVALEDSAGDFEDAIRRMKHKLREKKSK